MSESVPNAVEQLQRENDELRARLAGILFSGALDNVTCGDLRRWADEFKAKLARPNIESRAEIIEECVRACEWSWTHAAWSYKETVARIRALKAEKSAPSATGQADG